MLALAASAAMSAAAPQANHLEQWCGAPLYTGKNHGLVSIPGVLTRRMVWGPPNYGETPKRDTRYAIWVLKLDFLTPVMVDAETGGPTSVVKMRTMQVTGSQASLHGYDDFLNRHVIVTGTLWTAVGPLQRTPATLDATGMKAGGEVRCDGRPAAISL